MRRPGRPKGKVPPPEREVKFELRTCNVCKVERDIELFYKNVHSLGGRLRACAKCHYAKRSTHVARSRRLV